MSPNNLSFNDTMVLLLSLERIPPFFFLFDETRCTLWILSLFVRLFCAFYTTLSPLTSCCFFGLHLPFILICEFFCHSLLTIICSEIFVLAGTTFIYERQKLRNPTLSSHPLRIRHSCGVLVIFLESKAFWVLKLQKQ